MSIVVVGGSGEGKLEERNKGGSHEILAIFTIALQTTFLHTASWSKTDWGIEVFLFQASLPRGLLSFLYIFFFLHATCTSFKSYAARRERSTLDTLNKKYLLQCLHPLFLFIPQKNSKVSGTGVASQTNSNHCFPRFSFCLLLCDKKGMQWWFGKESNRGLSLFNFKDPKATINPPQRLHKDKDVSNSVACLTEARPSD